MFNFHIDLKILLIGGIVGLLRLKTYQKKYLKLFPFFLLLILAVELAGQIFHDPKKGNQILYNLFSTSEFLFYSFVFSSIIPNDSICRLIKKTMWVLPSICLVNILFIQGPNTFHTYTYMLGCLVMIFLSITYFFQLFHSSQNFDLLREPPFWISIGILFFYISSFSLIGVLNHISVLPNILKYNLQKILFIVNSFYYALFIVALLCQYKTTKSRSSLS